MSTAGPHVLIAHGRLNGSSPSRPTSGNPDTFRWGQGCPLNPSRPHADTTVMGTSALPRRRGFPTVVIGWTVGAAAILVALLVAGSGEGSAWSLIGGLLAGIAGVTGLVGAPIVARRHTGDRRWLIAPVVLVVLVVLGAIVWWATTTVHRHTLKAHDAELGQLEALVGRVIQAPVLTPRPQGETYAIWEASFTAAQTAAARMAEPALARQGVEVVDLAPLTFGINLDLAWRGTSFCYHPAALGPGSSWVFAGSCAEPNYGWADN